MRDLAITASILAILLLVSLVTLYQPANTAQVTGNIPCLELKCPAGKTGITLRTGSPIKECVCATPLNLGDQEFFTYENRDIQLVRTR